MMSTEQATSAVLAATGRREINDALAWIGEGRRLTSAVRTDRLLAALARLAESPRPMAELRSVARSALASTVDPSADLIGIDDVVRRRPSIGQLRIRCGFRAPNAIEARRRGCP